MHLQEKIYKAILLGLNNASDFSFDDEDNSVLTKEKISNDKRQLYECIMRSVAKEVKKSLNEHLEDSTNDTIIRTKDEFNNFCHDNETIGYKNFSIHPAQMGSFECSAPGAGYGLRFVYNDYYKKEVVVNLVCFENRYGQYNVKLKNSCVNELIDACNKFNVEFYCRNEYDKDHTSMSICAKDGLNTYEFIEILKTILMIIKN